MADSQRQRTLAALIDRYYADPCAFAWEVCGIEAVPDQRRMLQGVVSHGHVSVRSGHGTGKSMGLALLVWWFLCTRVNAVVPCTAPTGHQLYDVLWARLTEVHARMSPLFGRQFAVQSDAIRHVTRGKTWHALARTARPENPDALQGFHGQNLMFVIDEAAGVHDAVFAVTQGALTEAGNIAVMAGNPTRLSGMFYDSHHRDRALWHCLQYRSDQSPLVDQEYVRRMAARYGAESNIYRVRVLGEYPLAEEDQLIPLDVIERAVSDARPAEGRVVWAVDPARYGSSETALAVRRGRVIREVAGVRNKSTMEVVGWVVRRIQDSPPARRPDAIVVDVVGIGAGVYDRLAELGYTVIPFEAAGKPDREDRYANRRAEVYDDLATDLKEGRLTLPDDPELIAQLASVHYKITSGGKLLLESKEDAAKRGIASPDRGDAVAMTGYLGATMAGLKPGERAQTHARADYDEFGGDRV